MPRKKTKSTKSNARPRKTTSFSDKSQVGVSLSAQAVKNLNEIVESTGLSKSGVVEGLVTGNLAIASQLAEKTISIASENGEDANQTETKIQVVDGVAPTATPTEKPTEGGDTGKSAVLLELKEKIKEHKASYQALKKHAQEQES
ncbi:MAG: hypothetical protein AAFO85_07485, partial [Cyanobacteria bacterium J06598_4]